MEHTYVVIMAGGIGSRFWPYSRQQRPKQFQDILGTGHTLIQQTVRRFEGLCPAAHIFIATNEAYAGLVAEQLPQLPTANILQEPALRNTAPCIAYACYRIAAQDPEARIIVAPADHVIDEPEAFRANLRTAVDLVAQDDWLVTLGIRPTYANTGYGYIQRSENPFAEGIYQVARFTEKPDLITAERFLASGDFLWNAGIFIWSAQSIQRAFAAFTPALHQTFSQLAPHFGTAQEAAQLAAVYPTCQSISIDYAVMEQAQNVAVIPADFGWSDLGTWKSAYDRSAKDAYGNVLQGEVLAYDTTGTLIKTPADKLVVAQGLQDYIIAEYDNVLLICHQDQEQRIKAFLADAKARGEQYR